MFANPEELLRYLRDEDVKFVDVRFCDLPGVMQHFNLPVESFDDSVFADGLAFDGSSIRGFQAIHESDMLLLPDPATAFVDPFRAQKTLALNFFIHDPFTREAYSRDPRNVAKKAEASSAEAKAPPARTREQDEAEDSGFGQAVKDAVFGTKRRQGMVETMAKQTARTVGSRIGQQIVRGLLGGLFGGKGR